MSQTQTKNDSHRAQSVRLVLRPDRRQQEDRRASFRGGRRGEDRPGVNEAVVSHATDDSGVGTTDAFGYCQ